MLRADWHTVRLTLHILGATIWVGGQLTLAYLVPALRSLGPDAPGRVARRFNTLAWSGFAVVVATGIWAVFAIDMASRTTEYHTTLGVKLLLVGVSGGGAVVHVVGHSRLALAVGGALSMVGALGALALGVLLRG